MTTAHGGDSGITWFNTSDATVAEEALLEVCHCSAWVQQMVAGRPYADLEDVQRAAAALWRRVGPDGWREALLAHPRIGAPSASMASSSRTEQAGITGTSPEILAAIAEGNACYEQRFGHVFLIRARGRGPDEILDNVRARLGHAPATELQVAAEQHEEITALRLAALLGAPDPSG